MKKTFLSSIHERRSVYSITNTSPIPKNKIVALIEMLLEDVPSAFNCQSARVVVLFEQAHKIFWDIVMRTLRERVLFYLNSSYSCKFCLYMETKC